MSKNFFEGYYFKHQKNEDTLCIVVGKTNEERFIQVITKDFSDSFPYADGNSFSEKGIKLNLKSKSLAITGELDYAELTPIKYDIMGPFKFFPMECRHGIVSMRHSLNGKIRINGNQINFTDGIGYIEWDSGTSFPSSYAWVQANDFSDDLSVMVSVADIPFMGTSFSGCICVITHNGKEYRLATYLGVKVLSCTRREIILKQGKYRLVANLSPNSGLALDAPNNGKMTRKIIETPSCRAKFDFFIDDRPVFSRISQHASLEYEDMKK